MSTIFVGCVSTCRVTGSVMSSSRRRFLVTVTAAGTVVLAGCQDDQTGDGTGQDETEEVNWILENPEDGETIQTGEEEFRDGNTVNVTFRGQVENTGQPSVGMALNGEPERMESESHSIETGFQLEPGEYTWQLVTIDDSEPGEREVINESPEANFTLEQIQRHGIYPSENTAIRNEFDADPLTEDHPIFDYDISEDVENAQSASIDLEAMEHFYDHNLNIVDTFYPELGQVAEAVENDEHLNFDVILTSYVDRVTGDGFTTSWNPEAVRNASTEHELLGWIHPAINNAYNNEIGTPDWNNTHAQMAGIQKAAKAHPNEEIDIHVFSSLILDDIGGQIGMAYCENEDSLRIVETSDFAETSVPRTDDPQLHPKIENSNYLPEANPIPVEDQTDASIPAVEYHDQMEEGSEAFPFWGGYVASAIMNTVALPYDANSRHSIQERPNDPTGTSRFEQRNVAITKGLALDGSQSLREYNSNSVDFEEDIYSLGKLMDELIRFHEDQNWIIDYQPGNSYDGELNGEYTAIPVDEETLENVKQDETREYDHFLEQHPEKVVQ